MKQIWIFFSLVAISLVSCSQYDDVALWNKSFDMDSRLDNLEELCRQLNDEISSLQTLVGALNENDYVTSVVPVMQNGREIGYTITFTRSASVTIYHGKDGEDGNQGDKGERGYTPVIGVKQDADGIYYWTLDGDWLTDDNGNKIKAEGRDGLNGSQGDKGENGVQGPQGDKGDTGDTGAKGEAGITPQLKIEHDYWYVSYDNGLSWNQLGKATGENGKDGAAGEKGENGLNGKDGDSFFKSVDTASSNEYVVFTLADGTEIKLPTWYAFEQLQILCNQTNTNLSALQSIVEALQSQDYITDVDPVTDKGKIIGYTIKFAKRNPIVIYHGTDGNDGHTPVIGIKQDADGMYYWTLDGEFVTVDGAKVRASGTDGVSGTDGITPKLKISDGYWYISYNNGDSWEQLGKATGEDGKDGKDADSIEITQDEEYVYFKLADGTVIKIAKSQQSAQQYVVFEDANFKKYCVGIWDVDKDGEISFNEATIISSVEITSLDIFSLGGIEYFENLQSLVISGTSISDIDISHNVNLESLAVSDVSISAIDVSQNITLQSLTINNTMIASIDLSHNNQLTSVNVKNNNELKKIVIWDECTRPNEYLQFDFTAGIAVEDIAGTQYGYPYTVGQYIPYCNGGVVYEVLQSGKSAKLVSLTQYSGGWSPAQTWCKNYGVYSTWKCPTRTELLSIYSVKSKLNSTLTTKEFSTFYSSGDYWTSELTGSVVQSAYMVSFSNGSTASADIIYSQYARAVLSF